MYRRRDPLSIDEIHAVAPSVFATEPYEGMSDRYLFVPTSRVLDEMLNQGFECVDANQTNVRKLEKVDYARHLLRFRHPDFSRNENGEIPELILLNSHDGTCTYQLMLGFFRMACSNGLIASSEMFDKTSVRHIGNHDLVEDVIDASFEVISEAPKVVEQIEQWKSIEFEPEEKQAYALGAAELRASTLEIEPRQILLPNRAADSGNDVWKVFNTVQENFVRGYAKGIGTDKYGRRKYKKLRSIKSVDADTKFNKALWAFTEKIVDAKQSGDYTSLIAAE